MRHCADRRIRRSCSYPRRVCAFQVQFAVALEEAALAVALEDVTLDTTSLDTSALETTGLETTSGETGSRSGDVVASAA